MIKLEHPVYLESSQCLVIRELDSLSINYIIYYENYQSFRYRIRSSSQRRLRGAYELLCRQLRVKASRRWLQNPRPYLDKLNGCSQRFRRAIRRTPAYQRQGQQDTPPSATCLKHSTLTTNRGLYIPFFTNRALFFPLATKLST